MTNMKFLAVVLATLLAFAPAMAESICGDAYVNDGNSTTTTYLGFDVEEQQAIFSTATISVNAFGEGTLTDGVDIFAISVIDLGSAQTSIAVDLNGDATFDVVIAPGTQFDLNAGAETCDTVTSLPGLACSETCTLFTPSVEIVVKDWFPQNASYVFECRTPGYTPESYDWEFGDGHKLYDMAVFDNYHTYADNGNYTVSCSVDVNGITTTGTLDLEVMSYDPELSISIAPWYPKGGHYVFTCDATYWTPESYDWEFGDGELLYDRLVNDQYHVYEANGNYTLICAAKEDANPYVVTQTVIEVTGCRDLDLQITSIAQDSEMTTVAGTLFDVNDENADLGLYTVVVGDTETGVLLNQWSASFPNSDADIVATLDDWCGHELTATFETVSDENESETPQGDSDSETLIAQGNEQLANGGGARGDCAWGYSIDGNRCVKDEMITPVASSNEPSAQGGANTDLPTPQPQETTSTTEADAQNDLLTGAVIGGGIVSTAWLWVILGMILALAVWAAADHK